MSAGLNVHYLYESARYSVPNHLALIFPSLLGLINCVVCLPSITVSRAAWTCRRVMGKPFEELVVNVNTTSPWVPRVLFVSTLVFFMKTYVFTFFSSKDFDGSMAPSACDSWMLPWSPFSLISYMAHDCNYMLYSAHIYNLELPCEIFLHTVYIVQCELFHCV